MAGFAIEPMDTMERVSARNRQRNYRFGLRLFNLSVSLFDSSLFRKIRSANARNLDVSPFSFIRVAAIIRLEASLAENKDCFTVIL